MATYRCKMCGGDLVIDENETVAECEYCGTKQTVPSSNDEKVQNLFNRANNLRMKSEFDKAEQVYEKIIQEDSSQSEAYWGIVLCRYGIEYVEDPNSYKWVPTCHRVSLDPIVADEDYKSALENADCVQKEIYETEAKEIDRVQKEILDISKKEKPYDVFICYKETDERGNRTQDSVIANEIYYQLVQEGLKVFYAAITLEDKLGSSYEPYIFAALNSAKVMLCIGTKPEYYTSIWVKNEWSRFLKIIKKDRTKVLIPCYKNMDAYDLPDEFSHLQAQDMSKIGFVNDLIRGIRKIIPLNKDDNSDDNVSNNNLNNKTVQVNSNASGLLQRAYLFLEDGDWERANEYCEKVLDIEPKNSSAYICELLATLHVKSMECIVNTDEPFENNDLFKKAVRFADKDQKTKLISYSESKEKYCLDKYNEAKKYISLEKYSEAASIFKTILRYKDSNLMGDECDKLAKEQQIYLNAKELISLEKYYKASIILKKISGYKDADYLLTDCREKANELRYKYANDEMIAGKYNDAIIIFNGISDYKDSKLLIKECEQNKLEAKYKSALGSMSAGKYDNAIFKFNEIANYKDSSVLAEECLERTLIEYYFLSKSEYEDELYEELALYKRELEKCERDNTSLDAELNSLRFFDIGKKSNIKNEMDILNRKMIKLSQKIRIMINKIKEQDSLIFSFCRKNGIDDKNDFWNKLIETDSNKLFNELISYKVSRASLYHLLDTGDCIKFGKYKNNLIQWNVLAKEGGKVLLISRYVIDFLPYDFQDTGIYWKTCSLRHFLFEQTEFNFSKKENEIILETKTDDLFSDKMFLLNINEAKKYLETSDSRRCSYVDKNSFDLDNEYVRWWLRDFNKNTYTAVYVDPNGLIQTEGWRYNNNKIGVRPAVWINLH